MLCSVIYCTYQLRQRKHCKKELLNATRKKVDATKIYLVSEEHIFLVTMCCQFEVLTMLFSHGQITPE